MNYTDIINQVDLAAYLISLGYELKSYVVTSFVDLLNASRKRSKSGQWEFGDWSDCPLFGNATAAVRNYKMPLKGHNASNIGEYAKLSAHNYQVLKSVIMEGGELKQIPAKNYTMLKNQNGDYIPKERTENMTDDLAKISVYCALGGLIKSYYLDENNRLFVKLEKDFKEFDRIKEELLNGSHDLANYDFLPILTAMTINRRELMTGIYTAEQVCVMRGEKKAIIAKNATEEVKQKVLSALNR